MLVTGNDFKKGLSKNGGTQHFGSSSGKTGVTVSISTEGGDGYPLAYMLICQRE